MPSFQSDGVRIAYWDEGQGDPFLLIHGFASNAATNWVDPGWVRTLMADGRRVIAFDHLGIERADVMGYSMGARISAFLVLKHPKRVRSVIFAGLGINMVRGMVGTGPLAKALEAKSIDDVTNDTARSFRAFAEHTRSDLRALAACMRGPREKITPELLAGIAVPALVAVGTEDVIGGSGAELAALIPGAKLLDIVGRDHMKAVGDARFKQGVLDFLTQRP
jgi:pimeloyl-ACP methyl ester carboxylesterase